MNLHPGQIGNAAWFGLIAAAIAIVALKMVSGLAFAPLAVIAVLLFVLAFGLKLRIERTTSRRV